MCRVMKVSKSGYYEWRNRPESTRAKHNKRLLKRIETVHKASRKTYGVRRVHGQLIADGESCGRNRVARIMREFGIRSKRIKKFRVTTNSKHSYPVAENLVRRDFAVRGPNRIWASDITYIPTGEGWLYLATVMDLCTRKIVGWSMDKTMTTNLVVEALKMAIGRQRPAEGLIHHSDRGSQYASHEYQNKLKDNGMTCSMSRKGDPWDNAPAESFYSTLKTELVHDMKYQTRKEAKKGIFEYIEVFYNRMRLHSALGNKSPDAYEAEYWKQQAVIAA